MGVEPLDRESLSAHRLLDPMADCTMFPLREFLDIGPIPSGVVELSSTVETQFGRVQLRATAIPDQP